MLHAERRALVRGRQALVVADGSTFATASGVNPMLTIEAPAYVNVSALAAALT